MKLDSFDLRILELLQENARTPNVELSKRVHLSAPQCYRRIQKLEKEGVIRGYTALIDRAKLGFDVMAFVRIAIDRAQYRRLRELEKVLSKFPEILECQAVTGEEGYQLKVIVPNLKSYAAFLEEKLMRAPGVVSVKSVMCLDEVKVTTFLPLNGSNQQKP
ncbi:MAG: Lrp/AsnC family transcriptional regulator [Candidatus Acidiferrales bacterium]